ncbi:MAG: hypothetical protein S4CHLAM37_13440 [Chlamydiia bacterium]|nr:hypothetical protein [Chlamydiia bacterium]
MQIKTTTLVLFLFLSNFSLFLFSEQTDDFQTLQGKKTKTWEAVLETDYPFLEKCENLFRSNSNPSTNAEKIPKQLHFIWVGPKDFPSTSVKNVVSWIEKNPGFQVFFWSDRERPLPHKDIQMKSVHDFKWSFLEEFYNDSNNYAEKADLLRYEILYQLGGIYVDHDVECYKSFNNFSNSYDFFCALEPPHTPIGSTAIEACNNLIGSSPSHPILKKSIELSKADWEFYKNTFPGNDVLSVTKRVYFRTFRAFAEAVKSLAFDPKYTNIVFPAGYFNKIEDKFGLYAHHFYEGTWFESETKFEKNVRKRLLKISRKNNQVMLIVFACFVVLCLVIIGLSLQIRSIKKSIDRFSKLK